MPARIHQIALVLAIACCNSKALGQVAIRIPVDDKSETASKPADEKSEAETKSADDKFEASSTPKSTTSGGLQPKPSNDVLEAISAPNIMTEGTTPDSAAAKRGLDRVGLPQDRGWMLNQAHWQSSNICHLPLYFEDAMLERHGHQRFPALQPMISGSKFMASIILLPYLTTRHHPNENRYVLGHYRPGSCVPALSDTLPWDRRAAAAQALGVTGVLVGLPW